MTVVLIASIAPSKVIIFLLETQFHNDVLNCIHQLNLIQVSRQNNTLHITPKHKHFAEIEYTAYLNAKFIICTKSFVAKTFAVEPFLSDKKVQY